MAYVREEMHVRSTRSRGDKGGVPSWVSVVYQPNRPDAPHSFHSQSSSAFVSTLPIITTPSIDRLSRPGRLSSLIQSIVRPLRLNFSFRTIGCDDQCLPSGNTQETHKPFGLFLQHTYPNAECITYYLLLRHCLNLEFHLPNDPDVLQATRRVSIPSQATEGTLSP